MSYILDALTRSQQQRERATIPTLATAYLSGGSQRSSSHSWQGLAIGLASIGVVVALYSMSSRPLAPDAQRSAPPVAATVSSVSSVSSTQPPAVTEQAAHLSRAEPDTAGVALRHSRPRKDRLEHAPVEHDPHLVADPFRQHDSAVSDDLLHFRALPLSTA